MDYKADNWLRAWFCSCDLDAIALWQTRDLEQWRAWMQAAFGEWHRVLKSDGVLCFARAECVVINSQHFTKTAHLWGVTNGARGTNSNRVVVLRKS